MKIETIPMYEQVRALIASARSAGQTRSLRISLSTDEMDVLEREVTGKIPIAAVKKINQAECTVMQRALVIDGASIVEDV